MKIGQIVKERYEILQVLGEGGMAFVYKARDTQLERFVAIKTLKPSYVNQETFVDRFKREAKTAANLNHPNIVQIFDWGIEEEPYFVMEYIEGNTLTSIIAKNRTISLSDILFIGAQVSSGLHAAHQKGLVHRDIKPGNIMITPDGKVKVQILVLFHFRMKKVTLQKLVPYWELQVIFHPNKHKENQFLLSLIFTLWEPYFMNSLQARLPLVGILQFQQQQSI